MRRFFYGALLVLIIIIFLIFNGTIIKAPNPEVVTLTGLKTSNYDEVKLDWCVDGDTAYFTKDTLKLKVRFLGIDAPELEGENNEVEPYAKEAANKACTLLENAKSIKLEYETSEKEDKYGRILAWVWVDNVLLQQELVYEGLVDVKYLYQEYLYTDELIKTLNYAKANKKGIWSNK